MRVTCADDQVIMHKTCTDDIRRVESGLPNEGLATSSGYLADDPAIREIGSMTAKCRVPKDRFCCAHPTLMTKMFVNKAIGG